MAWAKSIKGSRTPLYRVVGDPSTYPKTNRGVLAYDVKVDNTRY